MNSFDDLMGMLDYPVFVVTTQAAGEPAGCLVGFATQISVAPPRFLVGVAKGSHTFEVASRSQHLAVHVLERRQHALAELFGGQTGHQINKFDRCSWRAGPQGMPILDDAIAWFVGQDGETGSIPGITWSTSWSPSPHGLRNPPKTRFTCPTSTTSAATTTPATKTRTALRR